MYQRVVSSGSWGVVRRYPRGNSPLGGVPAMVFGRVQDVNMAAAPRRAPRPSAWRVLARSGRVPPSSKHPFSKAVVCGSGGLCLLFRVPGKAPIGEAHAVDENTVSALLGRRLELLRAPRRDVIVLLDSIAGNTQSTNQSAIFIERR